MKYVSTDLETSAIEPREGVILEIGMVLENTEQANVRAIEELPEFCSVVHPGDWFTGTPVALAMNARILAKLAEMHPRVVGLSCADVEYKAIEWLKQYGCERGKTTMCAKNGGVFDMRWLREKMPDLASWFSHRIIDPGSVMIDWHKGVPSLKELLPAGREVAHTALEDARDNIRVLRPRYT